jgi:hypothetical protein
MLVIHNRIGLERSGRHAQRFIDHAVSHALSLIRSLLADDTG